MIQRPIEYRPLQFAFWLAVTGISFGLGLGWPLLFWLGVLGPIAVLVLAVLWPLVK